MMPSKGYFAELPCAFYSNEGCNRPHCHYRHSAKDLKIGKGKINKGAAVRGVTPQQLNLFTKLVEKAVDQVVSQETQIVGRSERANLVKSALEQVLDDPEALSLVSKERKFAVNDVPSYQPTPIMKLNQRHIPVVCVPEKPVMKMNKVGGNIENFVHNASQQRQEVQFEAGKAEEFAADTCEFQLPKAQRHLSTADVTMKKPQENVSTPQHGSIRNSQFNPRPLSLKKSKLKFQVPSNNDQSIPRVNDVEKPPLLPPSVKRKKSYDLVDKVENLNEDYLSAWPKLPKLESQFCVPKRDKPTARNNYEAGEKWKTRNITERDETSETEIENKRRTSANEVNMKLPSGVDPFTRWMKNGKLRKILGKTDNPMKPLMPSTDREKSFGKVKTAVDALEEQPAPKLTKRIAHDQNSLQLNPIHQENIKIPIGFRRHFCNVFYEELKKSMKPSKARLKATQSELEIAANSKLTRTYKNNCTLLLLKFRKGEESVGRRGDVDLTPDSRPQFTYGWTIRQCFLKYVLSEEQMKENGFPLPLPGQPDCAYVEKASRRYTNEQPVGKPLTQICAHCCKEYKVNGQGMPLSKNDCFYHWGKLRKIRFMGQWQEMFTCCDGGVDSAPCEASVYHVWSGRDEDCLTGYVATRKLPSYMNEQDAGIFSLDCEMCYTTKGLELARLTVLNVSERVVFDQVVALQDPILDYCTRFSGIDADKISKATYTFDDVRNWLLTNVYDKTILVGHSLENDLKALKLIHKTVVDTSVTFPHQFGLPNKLSLKHLASSILEIVIQENEEGHDSKEDAVTCLKLMMKKIEEDSKVRKPRIIIQYAGKKS